MQETGDIDLLRQYANGGAESDAAFAALAARYVNLVYSVAVRHSGNPHHAEEITQAVFIILARRAAGLRKSTVLSGWLYQTARLTAANFLRTEMRRARREQEAHMQSVANEPDTAEAWSQIAPVLDDAMARLGETDRNAVVLRFFESKSLSEVGTALGTSEGAARVRVHRALEKLRRFFSKHSITLSATAIAGAVAAHSVQAAPAGLALSAAAAAQGSAATASTLTLVKGVLKIMAWTKAKALITVGAGALLAGAATVTVAQLESQQPYSWQVPKASFDVLRQTTPQVKLLPTRFDKDGGAVGQSDMVMGIAQPIQRVVIAAYQGGDKRTIFKEGMPTNRYDYIANFPDGRQQLQAELKRQLGIVGRREPFETNVLVLKVKTPDSPGLKPGGPMPPAPGGGGMRMAITIKSGEVSWHDQPISIMSGYLENYFRTPVINRTGLKSHYDFGLKWDEPDRDHPNPEGLKQALLDQLGLELVPGREKIDMLVVERAKN